MAKQNQFLVETAFSSSAKTAVHSATCLRHGNHRLFGLAEFPKNVRSSTQRADVKQVGVTAVSSQDGLSVVP